MEWIPEPKSASGGLAAEGFYKLLGRPRLDPLTVLVRETAQNSWDARLQNGEPVGFTLQGWELSSGERRSLIDHVFDDAEKARGTHLADRLADRNLLGLYITDRNTKGLGGPVHANIVDPNGVYDWVDFTLNVGEANTQGHTGGTYGFGKTISYVVSSANSIVIHSRTKFQGRLETRLIACALGEKFQHRRTLYTGRHWWGENVDGAPAPITGARAERIAEAIGMPQFLPGETGTNILVLAPDLGGRSPDQAMRFIAESVTWHLWPKLMRHRGTPAMDIDVSWNGESIRIPRPEDRPPLHGFAQAFEAIMASEAGMTDSSIPGLRIDSIRCQRPIAEVGQLATVPLIHRERVAVDDGSVDDDGDAPRPAAAITGVCHHVALLRSPELVVDYLEGPPPPEGGVEWAGVFRANDDQDAFFAASEPPTHDSWNPELLPKSSGRTIVNVGLREIRSALENRWAHRRKPDPSEAMSTALVADELAHLVGAVDGRGKGKRRRDAGPTPPTPGMPRPKVDFLFAAPVDFEGEMATLARVLVSAAPGSSGTKVRYRVAAALDGTSGDADLDPSLSIVEARIAGQLVDAPGQSGEVDILFTQPVEVEFVARRGPETSVLFELDAEAVS